MACRTWSSLSSRVGDDEGRRWCMNLTTYVVITDLVSFVNTL